MSLLPLSPFLGLSLFFVSLALFLSRTHTHTCSLALLCLFSFSLLSPILLPHSLRRSKGIKVQRSGDKTLPNHLSKAVTGSMTAHVPVIGPRLTRRQTYIRPPVDQACLNPAWIAHFITCPTSVTGGVRRPATSPAFTALSHPVPPPHIHAKLLAYKVAM